MGAVILTERVLEHGDRLAIVDPSGSWTYDDLVGAAAELAVHLLDGRSDLEEARVGVLCEPGSDYVVALLGCWRAGGLAVPMNPTHPDAELAYVVADAGVDVLLASPVHAELARRLAEPRGARVELVVRPRAATARPVTGLPAIGPARRALMVYTSGTTGRPKGVVHTHDSLRAQIEGLVELWAWSADDRILLVLPLHHVHGIVNVVCCALWSGATCEAPGGFDPVHGWEGFAAGAVTLFMAVPTIYSRLVSTWEGADPATQARWSEGAAELRLMVSGSAALPVSVLDRWREISGHVLLERYGMTEIGMGLSNTLTKRVRGYVGEPLPAVEARLVDDAGHDVADGEPGELLVRGPQLFREYWNKSEETRASFVDGWFRTGDVAARDPAGYRILGRSSVDIIKSGGEKISALEIEEVFRTHPDVVDCAVVGVADPEWGERVCAAVVVEPGRDATGEALRGWAKELLAVYKVPSRYVFVDELPRNAMGKVTKPRVSELFAKE